MDATKLTDWVRSARAACANADRAVAGDLTIGELLAWAPGAEDGIWPNSALSELIESLDSQEIERGLRMGLMNKRGAVWRACGGQQERELAAKHSEWAQAAARWPRIAAVLRSVADSYEAEAQHEDVRYPDRNLS
jgi:hypothetical protein